LSLVGNDPAVLDEFPAQEMLRIEARRVPRDWPSRWAAAGGRTYNGRMIARKDDDIWTRISRFGTPFPPFDFGSGMGVADVGRQEAESLGVIAPGERVAPTEAKFNDNLQASLADLDDAGRAELRAMFGDQIAIEGDTARWQGDLVGDLYDASIAWDGQGRPSSAKPPGISLGIATPQAIELSLPAGMDIEGMDLYLRPDEIAKANEKHGLAEERGDQRPITRLDVELIPHVWRDPDEVLPPKPSRLGRAIEMRKTILGRNVLIGFQKDPAQQRMIMATTYIKTKEQP
jgi:hypothetical protein